MALLMNKIQEQKLSSVPVKRRLITTPNINKDIPWEFFDGAIQGMPPLDCMRVDHGYSEFDVKGRDMIYNLYHLR